MSVAAVVTSVTVAALKETRGRDLSDINAERPLYASDEASPASKAPQEV
ncbi:hypothetical protein ACFVT5_14845 [Streptomyces sp. NPDC058001]